MSCRDEPDIWILKNPLPKPPDPEPKNKRPRVAFVDGKIDNIENRIEEGSYDDIDQVISDVTTIEDAIISSSNEQSVINGPVDNLGHENSLRVTRFKHKLNQLLLQNQAWDDRLKSEEPNSSEPKYPAPHLQSSEPQRKSEQQGLTPGTVREGKPVLTLWGNTANGPKQLFSSFQRPIESSASQEATEVNDAGLPNGISLAKLTAFNAQERKKDQKPASTIGDVFKPPHNLKPLETPRQSKNLTRGSVLNWGPSVENHVTSRPFLDRSLALPSGQWLNYSETANTARPPSPEEKRRQRERALSFGEMKSELRGDERYDQQIAKDKSLFQTAYGSFAPSYDSTDAVVPEQIRRRIWWSRAGSKRFKATFTQQYPEDGLDGVSASAVEEVEETVESFAEAVQSFVAADTPAELNEDAEASQKDVDDILEEISDLLATLSSYQRIRNLSTPSLRPGMKAGNISTPSKEEFDVHELLRSQLVMMIATLPPYAVAKLNGDQLESLSIPTRILVENTDFTGTMEPDQNSARKQQTTVQATNTAPNRVNSPGTAPRPNYQALNAASYNARAYGSNNRAPGSAQNYQPQNQYRQPNQYSNLAASHPSSRGSTSTRPNFPQQYSQNTTPQYQTPSVQQFQRPTSNGYSSSYNQSNQHINSTGSPFPRPNPPTPARADGGLYGRSASPQKSTTDYSPYPPRNSQTQPQIPQRPQSGNYTNTAGSRGISQTGTPQTSTPQMGTSQTGTPQIGTPQISNGQLDSAGRNRVEGRPDGRPNGVPIAATDGT